MAVGVAVRHRKPEEGAGRPDVVSPCGACRDLLLDYAPDALVIVPGPAGAPVKRPLRAMLPLPYRR
jgi:cytidine deaminase